MSDSTDSPSLSDTASPETDANSTATIDSIESAETAGEETTLEANSSSSSRSDINTKFLADIAEAEDVLAAALEEDEYVTLLADEGIDQELLTRLETATESSRELGHQVVASKAAKKRATRKENEAKDKLFAVLRKFQNRAKRKFRGNKERLAAYRIGKASFGANRVEFEQDAKVVIDLAEEDALPGATPEKIAEARQSLADWKKADDVQDVAVRKQSELVQEFEDAVSPINGDRRDIQLAADAIWPFSEKTHVPVRRNFGLPLSRPMQ